MSECKIKIASESLKIEIEGTSDLIYKIFTDLKDGRFSPPPEPVSINKPEAAQLSLICSDEKDSSDTQSADALPQDDIKAVNPANNHTPDLNELILEKRRFTQTEWMILLAWFASHKGKVAFTKKDIRKPYLSISKYTKMRSNQLKSNLISLIFNDYLIAVEKDVYMMTDAGIERAISLLTAEPSHHQRERTLNFAI